MPIVLSSTTEGELAALFLYNAKDACILHNTIADMRHPQSVSRIRTDNAVAAGIANDHFKPACQVFAPHYYDPASSFYQ